MPDINQDSNWNCQEETKGIVKKLHCINLAEKGKLKKILLRAHKHEVFLFYRKNRLLSLSENLEYAFFTVDISPYSFRKIRILNGYHAKLVWDFLRKMDPGIPEELFHALQHFTEAALFSQNFAIKDELNYYKIVHFSPGITFSLILVRHLFEHNPGGILINFFSYPRRELKLKFQREEYNKMKLLLPDLKIKSESKLFSEVEFEVGDLERVIVWLLTYSEVSIESFLIFPVFKKLLRDARMAFLLASKNTNYESAAYQSFFANKVFEKNLLKPIFAFFKPEKIKPKFMLIDPPSSHHKASRKFRLPK